MAKLYDGHLPNGARDFRKPNFGLKARQIDKALVNASLEQLGGMKNNTHEARSSACRDLAQFLKTETQVKRLNQIERHHIEQYGEYLRERFETEEGFSASSARDYLSHVNVCLAQARGDKSLIVRATRDLDFPPKNDIATKDNSITAQQHTFITTKASEAVAVVGGIGREFGARFREGSLLDCAKALEEYLQTGHITLSRGTKGGQARVIPVERQAQVDVLERGQRLQRKTGHDNAVPKHESFKAFQSRAWREHKTIDPAYRSHGERKFFACHYYAQQMGVNPPVVAGINMVGIIMTILRKRCPFR
ncbi:phage integrase SAM-like domain-containing protein [Vibrio sp. 10N.261.46.E12]|uniref:phage integrase SAM-like domain-containing protein n=1 Tax=unclassified Vibrio TaxID=2614977 RepID=UPI001F53D436|nr:MULTISPECIES: phage integrase SAM-like domain-containing protein [unclassified Vibrio]